MLNCKDILSQSSNYIEEDLSFWEKMEYKVHLLLCKHCRNFVNQLSNTITLFKAISPNTALSESEATEINHKILDSAK